MENRPSFLTSYSILWPQGKQNTIEKGVDKAAKGCYNGDNNE